MIAEDTQRNGMAELELKEGKKGNTLHENWLKMIAGENKYDRLQ